MQLKTAWKTLQMLPFCEELHRVVRCWNYPKYMRFQYCSRFTNFVVRFVPEGRRYSDQKGETFGCSPHTHLPPPRPPLQQKEPDLN